MKLVRPFLLLLIFSALALAQTPYYVNGASGDNNWSGLAPLWDGVDGPKATIQAGIDAASPGDIVNIAAGTYTESIAVNKWIALQGAGSGSDPASNTVIHAGVAFNNITLSAGGSAADQRLIIKDLYLYNAGGSHNGFGISGAGPYNHITLENVSAQNYQHGAQLTGPVTLSDLVVQDCTFSNNSQQGFAIRTNAAIDGLQFNNCTMINNREACLYLYPNPATLSNLEVNGGLYEQAQIFGNIALLGPIATASFTGVRSGNSTSNAVLFYTYGPVTDVTFTDCEFYDASSGVNFYNTSSGSITNASVLGGTIDNCSGGIPIRNATTNVLIDGVQITNSSTYGIRIAGGNTLIQNSRIENNATGIRVTDTPVLPIAANNNIIMNNTLAVDNQTSVLLDAEENFWGSCNGPEDAIGVTEVAFGDADPGAAALLNQDPAGLLDNPVNENVDYFPWLCTPPPPPGGPVEPLFFATPTAGYPGMVVTFQNHSIGTITSWYWEFGDGQISTDKNPVITYSKPGVYTVRLTVMADGMPYVLERADFITVYGLEPCCQVPLVLVETSEAFIKEGWENAIDDDISGADGTVTARGDLPYAIFAFKDGSEKILEEAWLLTDTGIGFEKRWSREFRILFSTTGTDDADFSELLTGRKSHGGWEGYPLEPVSARYIKLELLQPDHGWRQIGEFQICAVRSIVEPTQSQIELIETEPIAGRLGHPLIEMTLNDASGDPVEDLSPDEIHVIAWPGPVTIGPIEKSDNPGVYRVWVTAVNPGKQKLDFYVQCQLVSSLDVTYEKATLKKARIKLVSASEDHPKEPWENIIDDDLTGWDGTATVKAGDAWAIFTFDDPGLESHSHWYVQMLMLMTDTGVGYPERWARRIRVMVSTTGTEPEDFETVYSSKQTTGEWQKHAFNMSLARYIKLVVDEPDRGWSQMGEMELYVADVTPDNEYKVPSGAQPQNGDIAFAESYEFGCRAYPNPFNPEVVIEFTLPEATVVNLTVYNLLGQKVSQLVNRQLTAGMHQMRWNSTDQQGNPVPSGAYIYRLEAGEQNITGKMMLVR